MWPIRQKRILLLLSAAVVAVLAMLSFAPAQPEKKPTPGSRKLPKPIVILGKGTARPTRLGRPQEDGAKLTINKINLTFPDPKKLAAMRLQKLSRPEKISLVRSIDKNVLNKIPKFNANIADFSANPISLDSMTPWIDQTAYLEYYDLMGTALDPGNPGNLQYFTFYPAGALNIYFKPAQAGLYLITCNVAFGVPNHRLKVGNLQGGKVEGQSSMLFLVGDPSPFPIFYSVPDASNLWYALQVSDNSDDPKAKGDPWEVLSVEVQYIGQKN